MELYCKQEKCHLLQKKTNYYKQKGCRNQIWHFEGEVKREKKKEKKITFFLR